MNKQSFLKEREGSWKRFEMLLGRAEAPGRPRLSPDEVARYFDAAPEASLEASYNVAPTNDVYVVVESGV